MLIALFITTVVDKWHQFPDVQTWTKLSFLGIYNADHKSWHFSPSSYDCYLTLSGHLDHCACELFWKTFPSLASYNCLVPSWNQCLMAIFPQSHYPKYPSYSLFIYVILREAFLFFSCCFPVDFFFIYIAHWLIYWGVLQ